MVSGVEGSIRFKRGFYGVLWSLMGSWWRLSGGLMECPAGIAYGNFLFGSCVAWLEDLMKAPIAFKPLRSYL